MPFLTELDPRLAVRGSRDPLAAQAVWSTLGRRLVGNLTLASADVAGFRTLLLGYLLAERDRRDAVGSLHLFLRWEQACAYARVATRYEDAPLGGRAARSRTLAAHEVQLGHERRYQVLGDQRSGGLWTLYHRAALLSGLVTEQRRLTPTGAGVAEGWLSEVPARVVRQVRKEEPATLQVKRNSTSPTDDAGTLARVLTDGLPADRPLFRDRLVKGRPVTASAADRTGGVQTDLADCLDGLPSEVVTGGRRELVQALVATARARGAGQLEDRLRDAVACESVLHPAQAVLDHVLIAGHGRTSEEVASQVASAWPDLPAAVDADRFEDASRHLWPVLGRERTREWVTCAQHMRAANWDDAVQGVLRVNGSAMLSRRGAPWASRTASGRIDVRVQVGAPLPAQNDVLLGWRNPYYLPPVLSLRRDLGVAA